MMMMMVVIQYGCMSTTCSSFETSAIMHKLLDNCTFDGYNRFLYSRSVVSPNKTEAVIFVSVIFANAFYTNRTLDLWNSLSNKVVSVQSLH